MYENEDLLTIKISHLGISFEFQREIDLNGRFYDRALSLLYRNVLDLLGLIAQDCMGLSVWNYMGMTNDHVGLYGTVRHSMEYFGMV